MACTAQRFESTRLRRPRFFALFLAFLRLQRLRSVLRGFFVNKYMGSGGLRSNRTAFKQFRAPWDEMGQRFPLPQKSSNGGTLVNLRDRAVFVEWASETPKPLRVPFRATWDWG